LDLLVSLQAFMDTTARLADYVFASKLQYERADIPMYMFDMSYYPKSWSQYTPEIIPPPEGSDLVDDWYVFWGLAKRLGLQLTFGDQLLDMETAPTTDELLQIRCRGSIVPLDELKKYPEGKVFDLEQYVQPALPTATGKFDVMPDDVYAELHQVTGELFRQEILTQGG